MNSWKASERRYPYSLAVSRLSRAIDALHAEREALPQYHPLQDLYHTVKRNFLPMLAASFVLIGALGGPLDYLLASRGHKARRRSTHTAVASSLVIICVLLCLVKKALRCCGNCYSRAQMCP